MVTAEQFRGVAGGSGIELDLSRWPMMITRPPSRAITDAELEDFLERYEAALALRSGAYISVLDLRLSVGITPRQRQILARRMNDAHGGVASGRLAGTAMIFTSALMRSLLTAVFWLRKSKHPSAVFANLEDAIEWGERMLSEDNPRAQAER